MDPHEVSVLTTSNFWVVFVIFQAAQVGIANLLAVARLERLKGSIDVLES